MPAYSIRFAGRGNGELEIEISLERELLKRRHKTAALYNALKERIRSGTLPPGSPLLTRPPFVAPHHTATAAAIMAAWPDPDSPLWTPELRWLLDRSIALVRADLGGYGWLPPGPELPGDRGPAWRYLYVYGYLAMVDVVRAYHRDHGIPDEVSWTTLADLGRNLAIDRRMRGEGWPVMQSWLTLHVRGGVYELGRLQFHRGDDATISLHIPESGPLTPEAIDASLDEARAFFPRHFPDEHYTRFACGSWLLDPQLLEYLPEDSNIARFQRRFELEPYEEPEGIDADVEVGLDHVEIADAAANLDRQVGERRGDAADAIGVHRKTGHRAVEIHQVQPLRAGFDPAPRHGQRIIGEDRLVIHIALTQAYAPSVLEIDRGYQQHGCPRTQTEPSQRVKLASRSNPARWLFSGWNWVANTLPRPITAAKLTP